MKSITLAMLASLLAGAATAGPCGPNCTCGASSDDGVDPNSWEGYQKFVEEQRDSNINFLISQWDHIMKDHEAQYPSFTAATLVDAIFKADFSATKVRESGNLEDPKAKEMMLSEMDYIINRALEENIFDYYGPHDDQYCVTQHGRGVMKGFRMAIACEGKVVFGLVEPMTKEEVEAKIAKAKAEAEAKPPHPSLADLLDAIGSPSLRPRRSRGGATLDDLADYLASRR